jgi:hypothetical protein
MAKTTSLQVSGRGRVKAARRSATEWAEEVAAWRRSGSSARAYALARGISASTLSWWASRGDAGHLPSVATGSHGARSPRVGAGGHEFLPVKVVVAGEAETPRVEAEIVLVGGRRVRVAGALTFEQLERLLQVVEGGGVC